MGYHDALSGRATTMLRALVVTLLALAWIGAASATTRGLTVEVQAEGGAAEEEVALYGASYALVIGIDNYTNGWPKLRNAVKDAEIVAETLGGLGFEVTIATDLDSEGLRRTMKEFLVRKGADPEARLFVWYAGHGHSDGGEGFLVPTDAPLPENPDFALLSLPLRDVGTLVRLARAKHVLTIFDSCFAGTIFDARAGPPPPAITRATLMPVRQFLTSGDADQTVSDDGTFRELFVRAVMGQDGADANKDNYITGSELGAYLADRITNLTQGAQTPRYGKLLDVNFDRGDFVFAVASGLQEEPEPEPVEPTITVTPETTEAAYELAFWDTIKGSENPADYQAYLEAYPAGRFAPLARARLASLEAASAPASEPEPEPLPETIEAAAPPEPEPDLQTASAAPEPEPVEVAAAVPEVPAEPEPAPVEIEPLDADYTALRGANVRAAPGTGAPKVGFLEAGSGVRVTGKVKGQPWFAVALANGATGFVHADLLRKGKPDTAGAGATLSADNPFGGTQGTGAEPAISPDNPFAGGAGTDQDPLSPDNPFGGTEP